MERAALMHACVEVARIINYHIRKEGNSCMLMHACVELLEEG